MLTRVQVEAELNRIGADSEVLGQLDNVMRFLRDGHDRFHGSLVVDNCEVKDCVERYFGLGKYAPKVV